MPRHRSVTEIAGVNMEAVNRADLADAAGFKLDNAIPLGKRADWLLKAVQNPYCFRVGDIGVKLEFVQDAPALQDVLAGFLSRKKSGL